MQRFALNEITVERVARGIMRRLSNFPHAIAWKWSSLARKNRARLSSYKDRHKGQRCFVIGNGPSLAKMDLSVLQGEVSFGANRLYLLFPNIVFRPMYYVAVNELVLSQFGNEILSLSMPKFLNWTSRAFFGDRPDILYLHLSNKIKDFFQKDITHSLSSGGTVTFVSLQLAYFMGCQEVILVGVDHNFADKGIPNKVETRKADRDQNHFHANYFPKGIKWQLPDLRRSELAYELARMAFAKDGRQILDATIQGKCPVFEKVSWEYIAKTLKSK